MRNYIKYPLLVLGFCVVCSGCLHANGLPLYIEHQDGLELEKKNDYLDALVHFKVSLVVLEKIHEQNPEWERDMVMKAIADDREKVATMEPLAAKQISGKAMANPTINSGPSISVLYESGLKESDPWKAMNEIEEYLTRLEIIHQQYPQWEVSLVEDWIKKSEVEMDRLTTLALKTTEAGDTVGERTIQ